MQNRQTALTACTKTAETKLEEHTVKCLSVAMVANYYSAIRYPSPLRKSPV